MDFRTIKVDDSTKISEILDVFTNSKEDLILIDENSVFSQPHLELLTDYPRKTATALAGPPLEPPCAEGAVGAKQAKRLNA